MSLIASAAAPVDDVRRSLTPQLVADTETLLVLVDLGAGRNRMGGSILAQVTQQIGNEAPDLDDPSRLKAFVFALRALEKAGRVLAYHDRSDGGLYATLVEMAFAGHAGISVNLDVLAVDPVAADWGDYKIRPAQVDVRRNELILKALFSEELGAVLQVRAADKSAVMDALRAAGLGAASQIIGKPNTKDVVEFWCDAKPVFSRPRAELQKAWSETSWRIARLRDNPDCADQEYARASDPDDRGLSMALGLRPVRRRRGAVHRHRGASPHGDPAGAGRQQPDGDGVRVPSRRVRVGRRAHDRPDRGPRNARRLQGLRRLRRLLVRRRAGRRRWMGQDDPAQPAGSPGCSPSSSDAATRSRWACATAAR